MVASPRAWAIMAGLMEYQVLARKFRPKAFDDVVGQIHVTRTLRNAIRLGRIHHAFLFTGTRGCGKTSTARILARTLNCQALAAKTGSEAGPATEDPGAGINPCNECESCREITAGSSLDVLEIDGASNNGVDAIRELRENVRFMPNKGKYKIYIVDEVHMLSNAAFNALLKTLEEPPAHVVFIFATTEPHQLPTTILSRCQRFDFKRIPPKRIAERLREIAGAERIEVSSVGLSSLARAAEGSMRDAQSLFDQVISFAGREDGAAGTVVTDDQITESLGLIDRRLFSDLLEALAARDGKGALDVAQRVASAGYEVPHFAREMLARIRDLMVVKVIPDDGGPGRNAEDLVDLSAEELETLRSAAARLTREEIDSLFLMLEHALEEMVRGGLPQLALEMAVLRMAAVEPIAPISDLLSRLEALNSGDGPPARPKGGGDRQANSPGPRVAPPERTMTATIEAPVFSWENFLAYVRDRKPLLRTLMSAAELARFDGERLEIACDTEGIGAERMREPDSVEQISTLASEFMKRPISVRIVARPKAADGGHADAGRSREAPRPARSPVEERKRVREEALASDAVKSAMDVLGAELAEVRPSGKGG